MKNLSSVLWALFSLSILFIFIETTLNMKDIYFFEKKYFGLTSLLILFTVTVFNGLYYKKNIIFHFILSIGTISGSLLYMENSLAFWLIIISGITPLLIISENIKQKDVEFHIGFYKSSNLESVSKLQERERVVKEKEMELEKKLKKSNKKEKN